MHNDDLLGHLSLSLAWMRSSAADDLRELLERSVRRPDAIRGLALAVSHHGDPAHAARMLEILKQQNPDHADAPAALAFAIGTVGDESILVPLQEIVLGRYRAHPHIRSFSAMALGVLARDDATPWTAALTEGLNYRAATRVMTERGRGVLDSY